MVGGVLAALIGCAGVGYANEEIEKRAQNADTWPAPGRDNKLTRHSPLKDINADNVGKLQMAWSQSTGALRGHEGQPLFIEDVGGKPMMFFISGCPNMAQCNIAQGLDLTDPDNPKQIWNYVKKDDRDEFAVPRACCDTVNRGASYADGKLVYGTLDGYVIALDAQTGKEAWVVKHAWPEKGETITSAPLIAENLVIIGFGGDEFAARGRVTAYNLADGKKVWDCHSTGPDADLCFTQGHQQGQPALRHGRPGPRHQDVPRRGLEDRRRRGVGLVQLRPRAQARLLLDRQPGTVEPAVPLPGQVARGVQHRRVRQQVVDDHLRPQGRHRRGSLGLPDDALRPVGL